MTPVDKPLRGIFYVSLAFLFFSIMQAVNKLLAGTHSVVEIAFYRNVLSLLPCVCYVVLKRRFDLLKTDMPWTMAGRVGIGTCGLILTFAATQELPLANATVLFFASTLILPVLARVYLAERVSADHWFAIILGMCGVLLVCKPSAEMSMLGIALALSAAFFHAVIQVFLRLLRSVDPFTTTFYFFLGGTLIAGVLMPFYAKRPDQESALLLSFVGVSGGMGQYFLTRAFQFASASVLSPFNYTALLWAVFFDVLLWGYVPGLSVCIGGGVILCSHFMLIFKTQRRRKELERALDE